jgi:threonine synthase
MPAIAFLECSRCRLHHDPAVPQTVCPECSGTLYVRYELSTAAGIQHRDAIGTNEQDKRWSGMWRYRAVLPDVDPVTLGEGWTPMLKSRRHDNLWLKEEGANPTTSPKLKNCSALASPPARLKQAWIQQPALTPSRAWIRRPRAQRRSRIYRPSRTRPWARSR